MRSVPLLALIAGLTLSQVSPLPAQVAAPAAADAAQPAGAQANVPVRNVVLYSSGVGYFEHAGSVSGNTSTELRFKAAQINDILKSLVLQDLDKGKITAITYPSQDPLEKTLSSFQVDITSNPSLADLLNQMRGAKVKWTIRNEEGRTGTLLGVEQQERPSRKDGEETYHVAVLNVLSGGNIRSVELSQLQSLELEDKQLQEELDRALAAVAQARGKDNKPVVIQFAGEGERRVRLGYVIETPIWKTSYRLVLPGAGAEEQKPILQGWAIVENQTDTDWKDVNLSLVSGRPISFVQDLYQPLYVPRPVVKPDLYASLKPQEYEGGMTTPAAPMVAPAPAAMPASEAAAGVAGESSRGSGGFAAGRVMRAAKQELTKAAAMEDMAAKYPDQLSFDAASSITAAASGAKLGELFQYSVGTPVTLPRQKSAMLPILNDPVEAERVSIYNARVLQKNPLTGTILKNTSGKHLLQGPVTVLENGAYAGDAKINDVPPGQNRLLSYGIDLQMLVDSSSATQNSTIQTGKIVKGVMEVARKNVFSQTYKAENKGDKDKMLVIEHPFRQSWELIAPKETMEKTEQLYRFRLPVAAGKTASLQVQEQTTTWSSYLILNLDMDALGSFVKDGALPKDVKEALAKAASLKQDIVTTQRAMEQKRQKVQEASAAQERTRQNMKAIDASARGGEYYARLMKRLSDQDGTLDTLQKELDDLQQTLTTQQKALADYLNSLSVG